ncbi:MAG TPA: TM0106 family RecB-like putative nuclease [Streptosporangiaceae bacterium]|nr:TM0106 family RecB-like putative nuclease [Streptosporangiaceae bacterium]
MATRYDISAVPPQGGYLAKRCPVKAQWDVLVPAEPLPPSPPLQRRLDRGVAFEREVVTRLVELHPGAVVITAQDPERTDAVKAARETETLRAMTDGVPLIIAGRLPTDLVGRRVGEPDLLVAVDGGSRYRPVDIKHHRTLQGVPGDSSPGLARQSTGSVQALCSSLDRLAWEYAAAADGVSARKRGEDLLQLAHYQRMLESIGFAAEDGRLGGIVGVEGTVTWYDLDATLWQTPSVSGRRKNRSTMAVYDFEFDFRLDIIAVAAQHRVDPAVQTLVVPVRITECDECPWWSWCGPQLQAGAGDVSLLPGVGWRAWRTHRAHGVTDRAELAGLDYRTATLVAAGVDLRPVLAALDSAPDSTSIVDIVGERGKSRLASLAAAGIDTLGDARSLDEKTASYSDAPMRDLPQQIDNARAALGPSPAYRRRGVDQVSVPRAEIEVDIDMENTEDGVYLWGTLVTDESGRSDYRAFVTWEPLTAEVEADLFRQFWSWLTGLRKQAKDHRKVFRAYCYNASAENGQLRRIAAALGLDREVAEFIGSGEWIDLLAVFGAQLITGQSAGLKNVAGLAGFAWSVPDPSGAGSIVRYDDAIRGSAAAIDWLLEYNRCDVEATRALRNWLDGDARDCPSVQDLAGGATLAS